MITEILQHRIEFWWKEGGSHELDECSIDHIKKSIENECNQGELCRTLTYPGNEEVDIYGWWKIVK